MQSRHLFTVGTMYSKLEFQLSFPQFWPLVSSMMKTKLVWQLETLLRAQVFVSESFRVSPTVHCTGIASHNGRNSITSLFISRPGEIRVIFFRVFVFCYCQSNFVVCRKTGEFQSLLQLRDSGDLLSLPPPSFHGYSDPDLETITLKKESLELRSWE